MARHAGFTTIELMVTIVVAGILMAIAVPNFAPLLRSSTTATTANGVIAALRLARSEAVKRGADVSVVSVSGDVAWSDGWRVEVDTSGAVIRRQAALAGATLTASAARFGYRATGFAAAAGTLDLCPVGDSSGRRITVEPSGRSHVAELTCP
jgi:type IV fimbrial biogenesis protein FimT